MTDSDHQMDVDTHPGGLPTSSSASSALDTDGVDLGSLNNNMKSMFKNLSETLMNTADESTWRGQNVFLLMYLTKELAATELKSKIIGIPQFEAAENLVKGFNSKELEQWKAGVLSGVTMGNWDKLIQHRTYI
jgi:hypothetical protein